MRIASLWVPDFPLAALCRSFPELKERPLAVVRGPSARDAVIAVSGEAQALGVQVGMTAAQARQLSREVEIKSVTQEVERAASAALWDVAWGFSPRVRQVRPGLVWLDVGSQAVREEALALRLWRSCLRVGMMAHVGMGNSGMLATVAAHTAQVRVVPSGEERVFLGPLPISLAEPSPVCRHRLELWGVRSFAVLAQLPRGDVVARLGPEGLALHRLACGEGEEFLPDPPVEEVREGVWLEDPVGSLEGCLFVLNGILSRLKERLSLRGEGFAQVRVELALEGGGRREYPLPLLAPTSEVPALLALTRLLLTASPPGSAVEGVMVEVRGGVVRSCQSSLFGPPRPHPGSLAAVLVRLSAIVGPHRLGQPQRADSHHPSAWRLVPFTLGQGDTRGGGEEQPPGGVPEGCEQPVLRLWDPPRPARVTVAEGKPVAVRVGEQGGVVVAWAGPYRTQGAWWDENPFARDDFDVATADGVVWRVFYDRKTKRWFADGVYD